MKVCANGVSAIGWRAAAERQGHHSGEQFLCEAVLPMSVGNVNCQDCGCSYVSIILSASWAKVSMDMSLAEASTILRLVGSLCIFCSRRNLLFGLGPGELPRSCCM